MSSNQLATETSPYLLQHKDNPVHWWPWGEAALDAAKQQDKPILLSIGYAACHWCHVMSHESFESDETAALMNEKFINIKVDREERPDIDHIYMSALQHLDEQGGWPLTMFLKPDGKPYWGGTYFPPEPGFGRPSFAQALEYAEKLYKEDREAVDHNAESLTQLIAAERPKMTGPEISDNILRNATQRLGDMMDGNKGGLRGSPKFPQYPLFNFLWRVGLRYNLEPAKAHVERLLNRIFEGGIYDHLGGGLARYSVDDLWLVPHFEKMLYDNALMMELAVSVYKETKTPLLKTRIEEIITWLTREMITEGGAFSASLDADSEGEEGKFYVWTAEELKAALGDDYAFFAVHYGVSDEGNWEGKNILNRLNTREDLSKEDEAKLTALREKLLNLRANRIRPGLDDKILADWNGMTIVALASAGETFKRREWIELAVNAYKFIKTNMSDENGLSHSYRLGKISSPAIISDYANMIRAALHLYYITTDISYLRDAITWLTIVNKSFWCSEFGGYFITDDDRQDVIIRGKTGMDEATPNANALMISNLMALHLLTGDMGLRTMAKQITQCFGNAIAKNIFSHIGILNAAIDIISPTHLIIAYQDENDENKNLMHDIAKSVAIPNLILEVIGPDAARHEISPSANKPAVDGKAAAYLCVGETCSPPITDPLALHQALVEARQSKP